MNIWLITIGEPSPTDSAHERLLRTGIFARFLAEKGHSVTWWNSTFDHANKQLRATKNTEIEYSGNLAIRLLHGKPYSSNLSVARFINHWQLSTAFRAWAQLSETPSVIVASYPTPELCNEAVKYGKKHQVPVLIDVRDLWPEVFIDVAPKYLKPLIRLALYPFFVATGRIFQKATGLIGLTEGFLNISLAKAQRERWNTDAVFALGYQQKTLSNEEGHQEQAFWQTKGLNHNQFIICFFGSLGHHSDFDTLIKTAQQMPDIQLVLCGNGDSREAIESRAAHLPNVHLPGFINAKQIAALMAWAKLGVIPYRNTINYQNNITNKAVEYLSGGVPIITGLNGFFGNFVKQHEVGFVYQNGKPATLVSIIRHLQENPEVLNQASDKALDLYKKAFVAQNIYQQYEEHLIKIVKAQQPINAN